MGDHGGPWGTMGDHGGPWGTMGDHGRTMGVPLGDEGRAIGDNH